LLAFLRDANTSKSVTDIFTHICEVLGIRTFKELFPVILIDYAEEITIPKFFILLDKYCFNSLFFGIVFMVIYIFNCLK
jgi:hypothetical protein